MTIAVSLATKPRPEKELVGLVYSFTPRERDTTRSWYRRPAVLGARVLGAAVALNIIFW